MLFFSDMTRSGYVNLIAYFTVVLLLHLTLTEKIWKVLLTTVTVNSSKSYMLQVIFSNLFRQCNNFALTSKKYKKKICSLPYSTYSFNLISFSGWLMTETGKYDYFVRTVWIISIRCEINFSWLIIRLKTSVLHPFRNIWMHLRNLNSWNKFRTFLGLQILQFVIVTIPLNLPFVKCNRNRWKYTATIKYIKKILFLCALNIQIKETNFGN